MRENEQLTEYTLSILKRAGSSADLILYPREKRSIDIIASIKGKSILLKVTENTNDLSKQEIADLKKARMVYDSPVVVIASSDERGDLEDEVIYYRQGYVVVTLKTLENYLVKREKSIVAYIRGSYVLKINSEKFREKMATNRISRGEIAEILGTSRKAVYMYEHGEMYITLDKALKLASILGEDIFEEFDLLEEIPPIDQVPINQTPRDRLEMALYEAAYRMRKPFVSFARLPIDAAIKNKTSISIVKETPEENIRDKIENAERIAEKTNTRLFIIRSLRDVSKLLKILRSNSGEPASHENI